MGWLWQKWRRRIQPDVDLVQARHQRQMAEVAALVRDITAKVPTARPIADRLETLAAAAHGPQED